MKSVVSIARAGVVTLSLITLFTVFADQNVQAGCVRYTFQRFGTGGGPTCGDAESAALSAMYNASPSPDLQCWWWNCANACGFEPWQVDTACAWDGSQYTETVSQEYGCTGGPGC